MNMQKGVLDMFLTLRCSAEKAGVSAYVTDNENETIQSALLCYCGVASSPVLIVVAM
jgi:hypothetical protein